MYFVMSFALEPRCNALTRHCLIIEGSVWRTCHYSSRSRWRNNYEKVVLHSLCVILSFIVLRIGQSAKHSLNLLLFSKNITPIIYIIYHCFSNALYKVFESILYESKCICSWHKLAVEIVVKTGRSASHISLPIAWTLNWPIRSFHILLES